MSSDDLTNPDTEIFEVLPGLPGTGPAPFFGTHSEGFVVRFHPRNSAAWIGNFPSGFTGHSKALAHPDNRTVVILAGGEVYQVDPENRTLIHHFGGNISEVIVDAPGLLLIFSDGICLWALDPSGPRWKSERLSWDGIRDLRVEEESVCGEAYTPMGDKWLPFSVKLDTGKVSGGSYP